MAYTEQQFTLPEMAGISIKQVEVHLKLYAGYVKNVNAILEKLAQYKQDSETHAIALAELTRRFPFEWNGMRLHELYFEALGGNGVVKDGALNDALAKQYGSFDAWRTEFKAIGMMRGIGWALLTYDTKGKMFHNIWVSDHEIGHLGDQKIVLAMDVWEHAFLVDYLPSQRPDYINAFFQNLRWEVCEARLTTAT